MSILKDPHQLAFRRSLEHGPQSASTIPQHVAAARQLLGFAKEQGYDLYAGEVPSSLLCEFAETLGGPRTRRILRGAALFTAFLSEVREVPLPELDSPLLNDALSEAQLERFLSAAAQEPEPYATLFALIPKSGGLCCAELSALTLDQVRSSEEGTVLVLSPERHVELSSEAHEVVRRYLLGWRAWFKVASNALFPVPRTGNVLGAPAITRRFQRVQKAAKLVGYRLSVLSVAPVPVRHEDDDAATRDEEVVERTTSRATTTRARPSSSGLAGLEVSDSDDDDETDTALEGEVASPRPRARSEPPPTDDDRIDDDLSDDDPTDDPTDHLTEEDDAARLEENTMDHDEDEDRRPRKIHKSKMNGRFRSQASKEIAKILPRSGSVVIRKRFDGGRLGYIGQYNVTDFGEDGAVEPFVHRHLAPQYGGGDYLIYRDAITDQPLHVVHILAPQHGDAPPWTPPPSPPSVAGLLREHLEAAKVLKEASESTNPYELVSAVTRIAALQGQGGSHDELRRLREDLEQLRRELLSVGPMGGPTLPLPPAGPSFETTLTQQLLTRFLDSAQPSSFESTLTQQLLAQFFESAQRERETAQRDRERLDALMRTQVPGADPAAGRLTAIDHLRQAKEVADAAATFTNAAPSGDKIDRLLDILAGPLGAKVGEAMSAALPPKRPPPNGNGSLQGSRAERRPASAPEPARPALPTEVPAHFKPWAEKMNAAETEEELIEAMLYGLASLHLDQRWQPTVRAALAAMMRNAPTETFVLTWDVLEALVRAGHLEEDTARMAITACRDSWDEVRTRVSTLLRQQMGGSPR
ncbi:MAG: hypothetical protein AB7P00_42785 [Sandaracinaceae bacterium]